jgi:hypothetical protein
MRACAEGAKQPLFEKSGAKTFFMLGHGRCRRHSPWPSMNKVFLLLFVHKKKPFLARQPGLDEHLLVPIAREGFAAFAGLWWDLGDLHRADALGKGRQCLQTDTFLQGMHG